MVYIKGDQGESMCIKEYQRELSNFKEKWGAFKGIDKRIKRNKEEF